MAIWTEPTPEQNARVWSEIRRVFELTSGHAKFVVQDDWEINCEHSGGELVVKLRARMTVEEAHAMVARIFSDGGAS